MKGNYIINTELLKTTIKDKKMKTTDLADQSENDWSQVKRILSGETKRPRIDTIVRMCDALEIPDIRQVLIEEKIK